MVIYLLLTLRYVNIKQRWNLKHFNSTMQTMLNLENDQKLHIVVCKKRYLRIWQHYQTINQESKNVCKEINGLNRFWSRHLTVIFVLNVTFITYTAYITILVNINWVSKQLYELMAITHLMTIFILVRFCSTITKNNHLIDEHNQKFLVFFQKSKLINSLSILKVYLHFCFNFKFQHFNLNSG